MPSHLTLRRSLAATLTVGALGATAVAIPVSSASAAAARATMTTATTTLHLSASATGMLMFNTTHLTAKPGRVTIVMADPKSSGTPHGIALTGPGVKVVGKIVSPGGTSTVTATVKKGTYTFYCPVPGHEQAGMKGTLTVT